MSDKLLSPTDFLTSEVIIDPNKEESQNKETQKKEEPIKDEPVKVLRADRDRLKKELEEKEKRLKELSELDPVKPIAEHIKKKKGKLDPDAVNEWIEGQRNRKIQLTEKEKLVKEKDERLKDIEITFSDEWKTEYEEPLKKSRDYLTATIVKTTESGEPVEPEMHVKLLQSIISLKENGEKKTPLEIKSILKKFSEDFEKKTGMEWDVPRLEDVVNGIESFHNKITSAERAKKNWQEEKEKKLKERTFEEAKKTEAFVKKEIQNRNYAFEKIVEEIDFDFVEDKDELIEEIRKEHQSMNDLLQKKEGAKPKDYKSYIESIAKAKAFDVASKKLKELEAENKKLKEAVNSSLPHRGGSSETKYTPKENESPTDFLN